MKAKAIQNKMWLTAEKLDEIKRRALTNEASEQQELVRVTVDLTEAAELEIIYRGQRNEQQRDDKTHDKKNLSQEKQELVKLIVERRDELQLTREKLPNIRHIGKRKIMDELEKINKVIEYVPVRNITELDGTFFLSAESHTENGEEPERVQRTAMEEKAEGKGARVTKTHQ